MNDQTQAPAADAEAETQAVAAAAAAPQAGDAAAEDVTPAAADATTDTATGGDAGDDDDSEDDDAPVKPKRGKKAAPPAVDAELLTALIAEIEANNVNGLRHDLLERLKAEHGARAKDADGTYKLTLAGITVSATAGWHLVLANWCNKARRTLMAAEG